VRVYFNYGRDARVTKNDASNVANDSACTRMNRSSEGAAMCREVSLRYSKNEVAQHEVTPLRYLNWGVRSCVERPVTATPYGREFRR